MQNICLLFAGRRGLDDQTIRNSILRIPEVSRKLKEAQSILEQLLGLTMEEDLYSYVQSSNEEFYKNSTLKALVAGVVQIGLFDRFVKYRSRPKFLVGPVNGGSAMQVCAGLQDLQSFIESSEFYKENTMLGRYNRPATQLAGVKLEVCGALIWNTDGFYQEMETKTQGSAKIIEELNSVTTLDQCVHIGPHFSFRLAEFEKNGIHGLASMGSIEMDPILNSFWKAAI